MKMKEKKFQVILFNGDDLQCYTLNNATLGYEPSRFSEPERYGIYAITNSNAQFNGSIGDKVELDTKQMKQIAKYNAERDVDFLIRKKQLLEEEIKMIEDKKKVVENKFKQLSKFANEFLNSNEKTVEDYIEEHYSSDPYDYDD